MNQDGHVVGSVDVAIAILFGSTSSERNRIHKLKVTWVETKRDMNFLARTCRPVTAVTHVVLDVAPTAKQLWFWIIKRPENALSAFAHDVGKNIESPSMCHR